jgi:hypothetical protein
MAKQTKQTKQTKANFGCYLAAPVPVLPGIRRASGMNPGEPGDEPIAPWQPEEVPKDD